MIGSLGYIFQNVYFPFRAPKLDPPKYEKTLVVIHSGYNCKVFGGSMRVLQLRSAQAAPLPANETSNCFLDEH